MADPMRVAHVMGKMVGGGVEQVVMNYYRHIDRSRVQFDFLVDADSSLVPEKEIELLGGRVFVIPPYQHQVSYQHELVRLFREECWPIVHSHVNALSVFSLRAARKAGVPVRIAHSHSTWGRGEWSKNAVKAVLRPFANVYPTYRMACSRYAGEWLFGERPYVEVLYNAIDLSKFYFEQDIRSQMRDELGLPSDALVIGHVGRFAASKNHQFLIDVFCEVTRRRDDAVLLLVGSGEGEALAKELAIECGVADKVIFLGQRDDVERLYQAFDVFVLPSLYEGLGLVGVEAQTAGLPCLFSDRVPHEANVTGEVQFLSLDDPIRWAEAICAFKVGNRVEVQLDDFKNYDIVRAAERLCSRYEQLAETSYDG